MDPARHEYAHGDTPREPAAARSPEARLLIVCPSWVGDAVMATPALRLLRDALPGYTIGALARPAAAAVLADPPAGRSPLFDEIHTDPRAGVLGPKKAADRVRHRRYAAALLLTNSFSSALAARLAGVPVRLGYDRDGRGLLLTDRLPVPRAPGGGLAIVPAVRYYTDAALAMLERLERHGTARTHETATEQMELGFSAADSEKADAMLAAALTSIGATGSRAPLVLLNPGGNNPAKRWPAERFAEVAKALRASHGTVALVSGSPNEAETVAEVCAHADGAAADLVESGVTLGALKALTARCALMVTNDTGPRHFAAALGTPVVSLFGPTDHRWTIVPTRPMPDGSPSERIITADPTLPETESANDHPERCRVDRIATDRVLAAARELLEA